MQCSQFYNAEIAIQPVEIEGLLKARVGVVDYTQISQAIIGRRVDHERMHKVYVTSIASGLNERVNGRSLHELVNPPSTWCAVPLRVVCPWN